MNESSLIQKAWNYATVLRNVLPGALGHVLVASMMALPGAVMIARIMVPGEPGVATDSQSDLKYRSSMDAVARGTEDGLKIYLQILAMLIVMVALVALADSILKLLPDVAGAPLSLERPIAISPTLMARAPRPVRSQLGTCR